MKHKAGAASKVDGRATLRERACILYSQLVKFQIKIDTRSISLVFCLALELFYSAHEQATPANACNIYSSLINRGLLPFLYKYVQFKREEKKEQEKVLYLKLAPGDSTQLLCESPCVKRVIPYVSGKLNESQTWPSGKKQNKTTMLVLADNRRSAQRVISL